MRSAMEKRTSVTALVLLVAALSACVQEQEVEQIQFQVPVAVEEVQLSTVERSIVTSGTLRAPVIETLTALVTGTLQIQETIDPVTGQLRRLAEGDSVKAGSGIAVISGEDVRLEIGRSSIEQRYESAKLDYESHVRLYEQNLVNLSELKRAQASFEEAQLALDRSEHTENRSRLRTAIDGVILRLARDANGQLMSNGQLVNPGTEIAQIAPLDELIADIDLVGRDGLALVQVGQQARISHHAWEERSFAGSVLRIAPTVNEQTRALRAEVLVDNAEGLLRPGMFAEVTLVVERHEDVPVVPRRAITERGGRNVAFVLRGQRVVLAEVVLGLGDDEVVEVRSGVSPGDRVVVRGLETLSDQMPVRVTNL